MTDYSQYGEQGLILKALGFVSKQYGDICKFEGMPSGRFLDIGAWNAKTFSNTRALYELGWSGVMVEPSPGPMRSLLKEYGKDQQITLIQAAVVTALQIIYAWQNRRNRGRMNIELNITDDALSTSSDEQAAQWGERGGFFGKLLIPGMSVGELLDIGPFDFVNIDTEGTSFELLLEFLSQDAASHQTRCYCAEHDGQMERVRNAAERYGYQTEETQVNTILWKK